MHTSRFIQKVCRFGFDARPRQRRSLFRRSPEESAAHTANTDGDKKHPAYHLWVMFGAPERGETFEDFCKRPFTAQVHPMPYEEDEESDQDEDGEKGHVKVVLEAISEDSEEDSGEATPEDSGEDSDQDSREKSSVVGLEDNEDDSSDALDEDEEWHDALEEHSDHVSDDSDTDDEDTPDESDWDNESGIDYRELWRSREENDARELADMKAKYPGIFPMIYVFMAYGVVCPIVWLLLTLLDLFGCFRSRTSIEP